jgi:hypothetical protein
MSRLAPALAAALAILGLAAAPALGDVFEATSLLSSSPTEQAIYAHDPVVSGDGRWVAFDGDYGGMLGVWRRALAGGPVEAVAVGPQGTPEGSAVLPSISYDGRYISFTTSARLDPADDTNRAPDVYVRDMDDPDGEPCAAPTEAERLAGERPACAFTLVSARDGSSEGLTYTYGSSKAAEEPFYGSLAAGRSAMNEEGNEVAFVTTAPSNLAGEGTPSLQVAVRYLASDTTSLVSVRIDPATGLPALNPQTGAPEPVSAVEGPETYGALFTGSGGHAPRFAAPQPREAPDPVGASLSADGSTVAWLATDVGEQAPTLPGETLPAKYDEPLWRRIADGTLAPTRRVTGGSDPASPACRQSAEQVLSSPATAQDPCQGPFATFTNPANPGIVSSLESNDDVVPRLSKDGYEVAFLANAPLIALGEGFGNGAAGHADVYLADMRAATTRVQALTPLTEMASGDLTSLATTAPIVDLGISPDGTQVAFTTKRTQFPLATPAYISPPSAAAGMVELFDADLANDTLTRVTEGFEGDPSERPHEAAATGQDPYSSPGDGALSPSFSDDGNLLVFSSTAANLVYGDGNSPPADEPFSPFDGSDVFVRPRVVFPAAAAGSDIGQLPVYPQPAVSWELGVTAARRRDGGLLVDALLPGPGRLRLSAVAVLPAHLETARRGRGAALRHPLRSVLVAAHEVSSKQATTVTLELHLAPRFAALATRPGGLTALLEASFTAPGHPTLHERFEVTFVRRLAHVARSRRPAHG